MDIGYFFKERKLRNIPVDLEKSKKSLEIAKSKLEEAKKLFSADFYNNSILSVYTSMFHASRALLYKDGIQEKSHYAVYIYIKEKYSDKIPKNLLNSFNNLREERQEILYGFEEDVLKEDVEDAILNAEDFLEKVKEILK